MFNLKKASVESPYYSEKEALERLITNRVNLLCRNLYNKAQEQVKELAAKDPEIAKLQAEADALTQRYNELQEQLKGSGLYVGYDCCYIDSATSLASKTFELFQTTFPFEYKLDSQWNYEKTVSNLLTVIESQDSKRLRDVEGVAQQIVADLRKLYTV